MKIEDLVLLPVNPAAPSPGTGADKNKFAECLEEAISSRQPQEGLQALGGPAPLAGVAELEPAGAAQEMVETVLSRLEIFQQALDRPGMTLKSLAPLVQALEKDSNHLDSLARSLPADTPLRQLVDEAAALTWTESCKFKRGDYV
jgi:hypothetical protein